MRGDLAVKELFLDDRELTEKQPGLFTTDDDEIILLKEHEGDFTSESLADYICDVEELYESLEQKVNLYIVMDPDGRVTVRERNIKSRADFTIKLAVGQMKKEDAIEEVYQELVDKITNGDFSTKDIDALEMIPLECEPENRREYRKKVLRVLEGLY